MQANDKMIEMWASLKERNDVKLIAKTIGITPQNVSKMIITGKGSITQIACIHKFYKAKKKELANVLNDNN